MTQRDTKGCESPRTVEAPPLRGVFPAMLVPVATTLAGWALAGAAGLESTAALAAAGAAGLATAVAAGVLVRRRTEAWRSGVTRALARFEQELQEHEQLARMAAESNPDAIVLYDDIGTIIYANTAARELFFEGGAPEGMNFLRLLGTAPEPLREALLGDSDRLFNVEVNHQHETYHVCREPTPFCGNPHTLLIVKHLTREVSRHEIDTLKKVVRVISHEVNNSLAPIVSLVKSGRMVAGKPEHADKLGKVFDTIEDRARHLSGFLEGYAGLARLPLPKPANVEWSTLFEHLHGLYPDVKLPEAPDEVGWFDASQVEQVLINLLKNALEAGSPPEDVELSVRVDPQGTTRMEVLDRGRGLSDEALGNAILPFYTTKEGGSGMGLALCREIIAAHAGSFALANRAGGGSVVALSLPGKQAPDASLTRSRAKLTLSRV